MICDYQDGATTTLGAVGRPLMPSYEFAVVRFDAVYSATRRHEKPGHDIYYFGGRGHWSLASLTFYHLNPVALDCFVFFSGEKNFPYPKK